MPGGGRQMPDKQGREKQAIAFCGLPAFPIMCCVCRRAYTGWFVSWHKNLFLPSDSGSWEFTWDLVNALWIQGWEAAAASNSLTVTLRASGWGYALFFFFLSLWNMFSYISCVYLKPYNILASFQIQPAIPLLPWLVPVHQVSGLKGTLGPTCHLNCSPEPCHRLLAPLCLSLPKTHSTLCSFWDLANPITLLIKLSVAPTALKVKFRMALKLVIRSATPVRWWRLFLCHQ